MSGRVRDKVALITGAARGQGRSHALRLAEEGADIIAIDIAAPIAGVPYPLATPDDLAETVKLVEDLDRRVVSYQADVRDSRALSEAVDRGVAQLGRLDIVSANAGIGTLGNTADLTEESWLETMDVNLNGVWRTVKAAVPHLIVGGRGGSIVLTSSVFGITAHAGLGHYVTSKHGLVGMMRALALELGPQRIRVNSLHPNMVDTPMIQNAVTYAAFLPDAENPTREDFAIPCATLNPLGIPWVEAIDVSNALLFLASDEARYITGTALSVDAGAALQ
jgi:SDR family mycofactocin-dependent oxidoreductase